MTPPFALAALIISLLPPAAIAGNIPPNDNLQKIAQTFHSDPNENGLGATVSVSDVAPPSAKHTLSIERTSPRGNARIRLGSLIPVEQGSRYYFSCQVKSTRGAAGVLFDLLNSERKNAGKVALIDAVSTDPDVEVRGNGIELRQCLAARPDGFNTLDVTFTVPEGVSFLNINLNYSWIVGTAWFGDFQFLPLDKPGNSPDL